MRCDCGYAFAESAATAQLAVQSEPTYFSVGTVKLILLSTCSFGIYDLVWFYKNWTAEQRLSGEKVSPLLRSIFGGLTFFSLAKRINERCDSQLPGAGFGASSAATAYLLLTACWRLPEPFSLLAFFNVVPLVVAQNCIDKVTPAAAAAARRKYTGWNIATIVVGGLWFLLAVYGSFITTPK